MACLARCSQSCLGKEVAALHVGLQRSTSSSELKAVFERRYCSCCLVQAIASRSIERARSFAAKYCIQTACTYEQLLEQSLDAVFMPLPTALATDWAVRFASAGFHVLVDKPFDSTEGLQRIIDACMRSNVYFMDGTHYVHTTRTKKVAERIRNSEIGVVKRIVSLFTMPLSLDGNIRADKNLEPMGALGDLGWYVMRSAVVFLGVHVAANVQAMTCIGKYHPDFDGIVECAEGFVEFAGRGNNTKVTLSFAVDCNASATQHIRIMGTRGSIDIPGFVAPPSQTGFYINLRKPEEFTTDLEMVTTLTVAGNDSLGNPVWVFPVAKNEWIQEQDGQCQVALMIEEFCRVIQEKDSEASRKWAEESLVTQRLVDAAFEKFSTSVA